MPTGTMELKFNCARCGSHDMETRYEDEEFPYGEGDKRVLLKARIAIRHCANCGSEYEDTETFEARHDAVCDHLGVMRPERLKALRVATYRTREAFANATGIGTASLARWESGALIQSPAYDRYMRLLEFSDVRERLEALMREPRKPANPQKDTFSPTREVKPKFVGRALSPKMICEQERAAYRFSLRGDQSTSQSVH